MNPDMSHNVTKPAPPSVTPDWELGFLLRAQGHSFDAIAAALGIQSARARKYAERHQWREKIENASRAGEKRVADVSVNLAAAKENHRQRAIKLTNKGLDVLEEQNPSPEELRDYAGNLDKLDVIARRTLGIEGEKAVDNHAFGVAWLSAIHIAPEGSTELKALVSLPNKPKID